MPSPILRRAAAQRVLGIDPSTGVVGWAVVECEGSGYARVASGVWRLGRASRPLPERLRELHQRLTAAIQAHAPLRLALESAFFGRNAASALRIGEARGVVMMTAAQSGLAVEEIPPASVKRRVAGGGAASKEQVGRMVRMHLAEPGAEFASEDESDAIAVALCSLLQADAPLRRAGARRRNSSLPQGARLQ